MQDLPRETPLRTVLHLAKFDPPVAWWIRHDPRGVEHGTYHVHAKKLQVHFTSPDANNFAMQFETPEDLAAWLRHTF